MNTKRAFLALMFSVLMAMALVVPASADTSGSGPVTVTSDVDGYLVLTITDANVAIAGHLNQCNGGTSPTNINVISNLPWGGTVTATTSDAAIPVTSLFFVGGPIPPGCPGSGTPFSSGATTWAPSGQAATGPSGVPYQFSYSLLLGSYAPGGAVTFDLTYSATQ